MLTECNIFACRSFLLAARLSKAKKIEKIISVTDSLLNTLQTAQENFKSRKCVQ